MNTVFVHGSSSSSRMWRPMQRAMDGHALDLPGAVGTPPVLPSDDWSLADDLAVVRRAVEDAPTQLLSHSYGGLLSLRVAREHAGVVRVVAHEPINWQLLYQLGSDEDRALLGDPAMVRFLLDPAHAGTEEWLEVFIDFWNGAGAWARMDHHHELLRTAGYKTFLEVSAAFADPTLLADWSDVACPVLLTVGVDAPAAQRRVVELWAEVLPDAEIVEIPGGHLAPLTHPETTLDAWTRSIASSS